VIDDLDKTLAALFKQELPSALANQLAISFLAPGSDFPPSTVTPPALDLFLYDLREERALREGDWELERDGDGAPTGRRPPAARIDCSYLITAWPGAASPDPAKDEHRLLGEVMRVLVRHPVLPASVLQGELGGQQPPLPTTSLQPGRLQSIAELWQAAGGRPKAAVTCTVTIGLEPAAPQESGPPVQTPVVDVSIGVPAR
jgi:hypothetical protein